jgi:membrane protein DedA with SNARE-associated domain
MAGAIGMPYRRFLPYSAAASVVWGIGNFLAGYLLGSSAELLLRKAGTAGAAVVAAVALTVLLLLRIRRRRRTARSLETRSAAAR